MTPLTRNRLIGGAVVALAAMLFVPTILTPEKQAPQKKVLNINIDSNQPIANKKADETLSSVEPIDISLTSIDEKEDEVVVAPPHPQSSKKDDNNQSKQTQVIQENAANKSTAQPVLKPAVTKPITQSTDSKSAMAAWVRVGSFADLHNAEKLAKDLGLQGFKTSVKTIVVSGTNYHRVLIGPFDSDEKAKKVIGRLSKKGFTPNIQH